MSNLSDYWLERAQQAIQSETLEDAAKVAEIERIVAMMIADIYKNLLAYYGKLATAEGIDWREAKKIVDAFDVEMFQMQAKAYVENKDFSEKANKELKRYNTTMYVNREQLLKHELGLIVTKGYAEQENVINKHLHDSVTRTLRHQAGILGADVHVKQSDVEAIVYSNFGKLNWSERLWNNQDELRKDVERMASHVMLRGRHPYEFVPEIRKKQKQTVANTKRLLITEAARVQTEAQKMHYLETMGDDAEYEFVAKRDEKTSKICRHYDKKVFKVKDMVPGINAPPMHPHCRSTTVPHVGNWRDKFFKDRQGKYRLKDEDAPSIIKESGAKWTDKNDPYMKERIRHATTYYESVRNRNKDIEIEKIAENTGFKRSTIKRVYEHMFENKYHLMGGHKRFDPDFYMANSWMRLREGKHIKKADLIMLRHEALEHYLMNKYNYGYREAHALVEKKYNYDKEIKSYKSNRKRR
ncbi:minor capsid protein [Staphylococcus pseudintermedius]|nr:phage head morphogenesis protein [Staphylococcus pseudintermedius]EHT3674532.1 minor capsid protein [Staphylococcus pseudintermedius]EJD5667246.1 minor capsid protein [Staphylococcus pseudintermedius]EJG0137852.1 minor capsid protein [Staphylococcus pseudintermedius]MDF0012604.1 minor capsid protein [Staphylococcus pseudintermedius]